MDSGFDKLSDELLLEILSYVPHDDYRSLRLVNHRFKRMSYDESLWRKVSVPNRFVHYNKLKTACRNNNVVKKPRRNPILNTLNCQHVCR